MLLSTTGNILSIHDPVSPGNSVFRGMEICSQAGFQSIDLHLSAQSHEGYPLAQDNWERWVDEVGEFAAKNCLCLHQAHAFHYTTRESTDFTINRTWYEERFRRSVIAAGRLGISWVVTHPCDFWADPVYDREKALAFNLSCWAPFVELAEKYHVGIAFENLYPSAIHERYCSSADELTELCDAFGSTHVGICWDTGHASVACQDQAESIHKIGKRLKATHIHDNHALPKGDEHLPPYFGVIAWDQVLCALHDIGYQGCFSFEVKQPLHSLPCALSLDMMHFLYQMGSSMLGCPREETSHA